MSERTKVIIVADEQIHAFFAQHFAEDWDAQRPVPDIASLWSGLNDGTLSTESSIVLITDTFYMANQDDFEVTALSLAPAALFGVISYDPTLAPVIQERVRRRMLSEGDGVEHPIYFIDYTSPISSVNDAIERWTALMNGENPDLLLEDDSAIAEIQENDKPQISGTVSDVDVSHDGLVIASTSSKGGSGKSTVSLMLASQITASSRKAHEAGLVEQPLKVCVVDMDIRDGQIGFLIGQSAPTSLNIRLAPDWGPETISKNLVYDERSGIWALLAPKSGRTADDTGPDFYRVIIENLRSMFDVIILDTSVYYLDQLIFDVCLPDSDAVLFVTSMSIASVFGMSRWFNEVVAPRDQGGAGIDTSKIGIVVNGSVPGVGIDRERIILAGAGAPVIGGIPLDTAAFLAAGNQNRLSDMLYHQQIGPAYFSLAQKIVGKRSALLPLVEPEEENRNRKSNGARRSSPAAQPVAKPARRRLFGGRR